MPTVIVDLISMNEKLFELEKRIADIERKLEQKESQCNE